MTVMAHFPPPLDLAFYRAAYADLRHLSDEGLSEHYHRHGKVEGRIGNTLRSRQDFVALMGDAARILEVGPFTNPLVSGANVRYADFLSQDQLIIRAEQIGVDAANVPRIDYILSEQPLSAIDEDFDFVLTSHCIEHQPDLIQHLSDVQRLIERCNGKYIALIPDKRFCFDRFLPVSTVADVLERHVQGAKVHSLKSVIEHRALTTHNDPGLHWIEKDMPKPAIAPDRVQNAISEWHNSGGAYIDVHAWYFTPSSFVEIMDSLYAIGKTNFVVETIYETRFGSNEFWTVTGLPRAS